MHNQEKIDYEQQLIDDIAGFTHDPYGHAMYAYPWGEKDSALAKHKGPREWQSEILHTIGDHLSDPETRHQPLQISVGSGHGIGKSALVAMISGWGLDTCEDTKIVITANTEPQLRTKTAPEVQKWRNMSITSHWFNAPAMSIYSNDPGHEKQWRCDFIPWSVNNTEAFAGLHNEGKRIIIIFDEASGIDDLIWEVTEGALTDEDTEIIWIAFGNPTRNIGRFRECFRKYSRYWVHKKIDSRTVEGTNKKQIKKWEEMYGEDSDFFRVRVKGEFPRMSSAQFISTEILDEAKGKHLRKDQYDFAPVIITCDPAWTGEDAIVIAKRQGLAFTILEKIPKNDNDVLIANKISRYEDEYGADAVFIDGGFGTGIYSAGKTMGRNWLLVWFSEKSIRADCINKRSEMFVNAKEWLQQGGAIPDDDELYEEAIAIETKPRLDGKYQFEDKDKLRDVLGRSPNCWDALCLSFAYPVRKKVNNQLGHAPGTLQSEFDPYE